MDHDDQAALFAGFRHPEPANTANRVSSDPANRVSSDPANMYPQIPQIWSWRTPLIRMSRTMSLIPVGEYVL